jgi:hypothetical protein
MSKKGVYFVVGIIGAFVGWRYWIWRKMGMGMDMSNSPAESPAGTLNNPIYAYNTPPSGNPGYYSSIAAMAMSPYFVAPSAPFASYAPSPTGGGFTTMIPLFGFIGYSGSWY